MKKRATEARFKLIIVGLLQSGQTAPQVSRDYALNEGMIRSRRDTDVEKKFALRFL